MTRADELEAMAVALPFDSEGRKTLRAAATELEQALMQVAGLRKAVEFYANADNHKPIPVPTSVSEDGGEIARRALRVLFPE